MLFQTFYPSKYENYKDILKDHFEGWEPENSHISNVAFIFWEKESYLDYPNIDQEMIDFKAPNVHLFYGNEFYVYDYVLTIKVIAKNRNGINSIMNMINTEKILGKINLVDVLKEKQNLYVFLENNVEDTEFYTKYKERNGLLSDFANFNYKITEGEVIVNNKDWFNELLKVKPFSPFRVEIFGQNPEQSLIENVNKQIEKLDNRYFTYDPEFDTKISRLNDEYGIILKSNWTNAFLAAIKVLQKMKDMRIPINLRGSFSSSSIISFNISDNFEFDNMYNFCERCGHKNVGLECQTCKKEIVDDLLGNADFDLAFDMKNPFLEVNYPDLFQDKIEFLNECFKNDGLVATRIFDDNPMLQKFVLTPYNVVLPLDADGKVCLYSKWDLGEYFPIVGLYTNKYITKRYEFMKENSFNLEIVKINEYIFMNNLDKKPGGINLNKLIDLANIFNVRLDKRKTLMKLLGILLFKAEYTENDSNLDAIITNREELLAALIKRGEEELHAKWLVKNYLKSRKAKIELEKIFPEFNSNNYLRYKAHIYETLKLIYADLLMQNYSDIQYLIYE